MMALKTRAIAALQARLEATYAQAGKAVWKSDFDFNANGLVLLKGKWYHTDASWAEVYGPYETRLEVCEALDRRCGRFDRRNVLAAGRDENDEPATIFEMLEKLRRIATVGEGP